MNRHVPHQISFDTVAKFEKRQNIVLYVATGLSLMTAIIGLVNESNFTCKKPVEILLNSISSLCALSYMVLDMYVNYLFYHAENKRKLDFIDHSFDSNFSGGKSTGYFTNDNIIPGIYKMAVNCFENSLFSSTVSKLMLNKSRIVALSVLAILVFSACVGSPLMVNLIIQSSFTGIVIFQAIKLELFHFRTTKIHDDFKTLFNDLSQSKSINRKNAEMIRNVLLYESTLAWGSILLNSKVFGKMNPALSVDWNKLKRVYKIE